MTNYSDAMPIGLYDLLMLKIPMKECDYNKFNEAWRSTLQPALRGLGDIQVVISARVLGDLLETMCIAMKFLSERLLKIVEAFEGRMITSFVTEVRRGAKRPLDTTSILHTVGDIPSADLTFIASEIRQAAENFTSHKKSRFNQNGHGVDYTDEAADASILLEGREGEERIDLAPAQESVNMEELAALSQLWEDELSESLNTNSLPVPEPTIDNFADTYDNASFNAGNLSSTHLDPSIENQSVDIDPHTQHLSGLIKDELVEDLFVGQSTQSSQNDTVSGLVTPSQSPRNRQLRKLNITRTTTWTTDELRARSEAYLSALDSMKVIRVYRIPMHALFGVPNCLAKSKKPKNCVSLTQAHNASEQDSKFELPDGTTMQFFDRLADDANYGSETNDQGVGFEPVDQADDIFEGAGATNEESGSLNLSDDLSIYKCSIDPVSRGNPYQRPSSDSLPYAELSDIYNICEQEQGEQSLLGVIKEHTGSLEFDDLVRLSHSNSQCRQSSEDNRDLSEGKASACGNDSQPLAHCKAELFLNLLTLSQEGKVTLIQLDPYQTIWVEASS